MTRRVSTVLFDLDDTLSDFGWSQREAFAALLRHFGVVDPVAQSGTADGAGGGPAHKAGDPAPESHLDAFTRLARPLWHQLERGELTLETLNDTRFRLLVEHTGLDLDPARLAPTYLDYLGTSGGLIDGAVDLLDALQGNVRMGLITNGYAEVQRPRLARFDLAKYFDAVVISSEVGHAKPSAEFFAVASQALGSPDPSTTLVVGDSLSSDIAGGAAAGMMTCWFNPAQRTAPAGLSAVDHIVNSLDQILDIVLR